MIDLQHDPFDLIIIKQKVIPDEDIDELMLLTPNNKGVKQASIINRDDDGNDTSNRI